MSTIAEGDPRRDRPRSGLNADRDDQHPAVAQNGGAGADLNGALAAVPARHRDAQPPCGRVGRHRGRGGQALPCEAGPPFVPGRRGGVGSYRTALRRKRVMQAALRRLRVAKNSRAAKPLSATTTSSRPGSQRQACNTSCPQSVSILCRRPRVWQQCSKGQGP